MNKHTILLVVGIAILLLAFVVSIVFAADSDIVISEVMYEAKIESGSPANRGEWIEIYNKGNAAVDLNGWKIQDNSSTVNTIQTSMCPGNSCEIPAGGCWLIARTQADLQDEFNQYSNPSGQTVDTSRTIFLGVRIGNGLANSSDHVILKNPSDGNVDCVSWANVAGTVCSSLAYVTGGGGADTSLNDAADGQAITNIQGSWYEHESNGSPYDCTNTAEGGTPTGITLYSLTAHSEQSAVQLEHALATLFRWPIAALVSLVAMGASLVALRRRRAG